MYYPTLFIHCIPRCRHLARLPRTLVLGAATKSEVDERVRVSSVEGCSVGVNVREPWAQSNSTETIICDHHSLMTTSCFGTNSLLGCAARLGEAHLGRLNGRHAGASHSG